VSATKYSRQSRRSAVTPTPTRAGRRAAIVIFTAAAVCACAIGVTTTGAAGQTDGSAKSPPAQASPAVTKRNLNLALAQLPAVVRAAMRKTGDPGIAVGVVWRDQAVFVKGFGVRAAGKPAMVTPDTVFQLASTSKPVASTVVAAAVGQKKLAWDDPVVKYMPTFALADPYVSQNVTVADLFSHRSGLPGHAGDYLQYLGYDRDYVLSHLRGEPLTAFRSSYAYTNFGLTAAAIAAATAAGTDWEDLSAKMLYQPLDMTSTSSRFADYLSSGNRALTHVKIDGKWVAKYTFDDDPASPAGGVSSNARDMTRWMRLQLANGKFDGKQVIEADALARTHLPASVAATPSAPAGRAGFYGLGWNVGYDALGRLALNHSGEFVSGAGTTVSLLPTEQLGIVVLTNASANGAAEAIAATFLDDATYGKSTVNWLSFFTKLLGSSNAPGDPDYSQPPAKGAPAQSDSTYVGTYTNDYYGRLTIVAKDGGLVMQLGPKNMDFALTHYDGSTFSNVPLAETPAQRSSVTFSVPDGENVASSVTIGVLDADGLGTFTRTSG
jgi:CubicO group peptidase (beta-lactamase class C family)